jgi:hypothetical protein
VRIFRIVVLAAVAAGVMAVRASPASSHLTKVKPFTVTHGPVSLVYVDAALTGPSLGDVYYASIPAKGPGDDAVRVVGGLTTVAGDTPETGKEIRTTNLVFMFSKAEDQIQIGGASVHSKTAATRPTQSVTVRPIVGGSGKYAGAGGWCTAVHTRTGNWPHTFHLTS